MTYSNPDILTICTGLATAGLHQQAMDIQKYVVAAEMVLLGVSQIIPDYTNACYAAKEIEQYGYLKEAAQLGEHMRKLQDKMMGYSDGEELA